MSAGIGLRREAAGRACDSEEAGAGGGRSKERWRQDTGSDKRPDHGASGARGRALDLAPRQEATGCFEQGTNVIRLTCFEAHRGRCVGVRAGRQRQAEASLESGSGSMLVSFASGLGVK